MKPKILILVFVLVVCGIAYHYIKNHSINLDSSLVEMARQYDSEKNNSAILSDTFQALQSKDRIVSYSETKLGLIQITNEDDDVTYVRDAVLKNKRVFVLIDFITPSISALTSK